MANRHGARHPRGAVALAVAGTLLLAACGSGDDDDSSQDGTTEEETTEDDTTAAEPTEVEGSEEDEGETEQDLTWYRNPSDVRESEIWRQDYRRLTVDDDGTVCSTRDGVTIVYSVDGEDPGAEVEAVLGQDSVDGAEPLTESGTLWRIQLADVDLQPIAAATRLNADGVVAAPEYELFPMPGRMFFPGNLPGPSEPGTAVEAATSDDGSFEPTVHVIDTGLVSDLGLPGDVTGGSDERELLHIDPDTGDLDGSTATGHGTFVSGVLAKNGPFAIDNIALPSDGRSRFYEIDLLEAARDVPDGAIVNLSLGTVTCQHGAERLDDGEEGGDGGDDGEDQEIIPLAAAPLVSLEASRLLTDNGSVLVAAAGNTGGDDPLDVAVYPAAFTSRWSEPDWCDDNADALTCSETWNLAEDGDEAAALSEMFAAVGDGIVAVGADEGADGIAYSTIAPWVTTYLPGCQNSFFPSGSVDYRDLRTNPVLDDVPLTFEDATPDDDTASYSLAEWCGTSFATAVASAAVATAVSSSEDADVTPRDVLDDLGWTVTKP